MNQNTHFTLFLNFSALTLLAVIKKARFLFSPPDYDSKEIEAPNLLHTMMIMHVVVVDMILGSKVQRSGVMGLENWWA